MPSTMETIKTLIAAGTPASEVSALIDKHATSAGQRFDQIRNDPALNEEFRRWSFAVASSRARKALDEELATLVVGAKRADRADAEAVFGVAGLKGDAATLAISRRDAADRAAAITERRERREALQRATRTGDEVLARAIAEVAFDQGDTITLEAFIADRPELEGPAVRLWNAQRAETGGFKFGLQLLALQPPELSDLNASAIDVLAENKPAAPPKAAPLPMIGMHAVGPGIY